MGKDVPGQLGQLANRLADRLRNGANLEEVLQRDELGFPPVWRSVVLAGMQSGHLPAALEGLSHAIRRASDVRRSIAASLIYPFIVVAIACVFLTFSLTKLVPTWPEPIKSWSPDPTRYESGRAVAQVRSYLGTLGAVALMVGHARLVVPQWPRITRDEWRGSRRGQSLICLDVAGRGVVFHRSGTSRRANGHVRGPVAVDACASRTAA